MFGYAILFKVIAKIKTKGFFWPTQRFLERAYNSKLIQF